MKNILIGAVLALALLAATYQSYEAYKWKHVADERGWLASQSGTYLFAPSGVKDAQGHELRRVDLLDFLIAKELKK